VAGKRFFIHESVFEEFRKKFLEEMARASAGDPQEESTLVGPLAHPSFVETLEEQVQKAQSQGAQFYAVAPRNKNFSSRGVLDFGANLKGFSEEEVFGPIALLYKFNDVESVISVVNDSLFGLGGGVFTQDVNYARKLARRVHVGTFTINSFVQSDPRVPFGGMRDSGMGREMGIEGLHDFVSWKVVGEA
jgi:succinate-semialdehyde dehydrogenase/glutarate-semialdehyde dehydrogenase